MDPLDPLDPGNRRNSQFFVPGHSKANLNAGARVFSRRTVSLSIVLPPTTASMTRSFSSWLCLRSDRSIFGPAFPDQLCFACALFPESVVGRWPMVKSKQVTVLKVTVAFDAAKRRRMFAAPRNFSRLSPPLSGSI